MIDTTYLQTVISPHIKRQLKAQSAVSKAIREGVLVRPDTCELCGSIPLPAAHAQIVAHHWQGYEGDAAIDVLWICASCNVILRGQKYHNGSVTKEEAQSIIEANRKAKQDKANQPRAKEIRLRDYEVNFEIRLRERRYRYKVIVKDAQDQRAAIDFARDYTIAETGAEQVRLLWAGRYCLP